MKTRRTQTEMMMEHTTETLRGLGPHTETQRGRDTGRGLQWDTTTSRDTAICWLLSGDPPPPPPPPPPPSRPLTRTALRVRNVELRDFGGSDEGLANLAESFKQTIYRRRWLSLSRSIFSSSSSASSPSSSSSVSDHSDCSDLESVSEGCWETDSDVG